jgi:cell division inhibitor SepF
MISTVFLPSANKKKLEEKKMSKVGSKFRNWLGFDYVDEEEERSGYEGELEDELELDPPASFEEKRRDRGSKNKVVDLPVPAAHNKLIVYRPVSYDDTMSIIGNLRMRKPIILNMENIDVDVAQRILDFMSGACSAMGGDISKISSKIFAVVPADYDIVGNSDGIRE